ncbi:MAG: hypothetical protein KF906_11235 [Actinobacteria bacterium]|nr:hypothetical protein [Actinomycetota bacterium]
MEAEAPEEHGPAEPDAADEAAGDDAGGAARRERRFVAITVVLVAIGYLAMATVATTTLPWRGTADAGSHLNYVQAVHHGHLLDPYGKSFEDFIEDPAERDDIERQYASAHPPAYYAVLAVLVGGDLDDHEWIRAVITIRSLNVVLGLVGLLAMAAFGWIAGGRWRARLAVVVPAVGTATFAYLRFSAEVYNDMAVTAIALVSLAIAARQVVRGPTARGLVALAVLGALGMGTKATYVVTLGSVALLVVAAAVLHGPPGRRRWARGIASAAGVVLFAAASFAWFYERNRRLSGSWYRSTGKVPVGDRTRRTLADVLGGDSFYLIPFERAVGTGNARWRPTARRLSLAVSLPALLATIGVLARKVWSRANALSTTTVVLGSVLVADLLGHYALQASHAVGYGADNARYFLPASLVIGLALGIGVAAAGRASALLVPLLVGALWAANVVSMAVYGRDADELAPSGALGSLRDRAVENDLPAGLPMVLLGVAALALVGVGVQIWRHRDLFGASPRTVDV